MRKAVLLSLILLLAAGLASAAEKHQSYISYDDGGTMVRQAEDGREIEARVNLPVFPGDEIVTGRRGRAEIRLSDGNVLAIDRASAVRLPSILDSYEGEDSQTVVELRYGKIGIHRTDIGREMVRVDTRSASYVAHREAVYFVEADARGADRVVVFDGAIEVRTPTRSTRLRAGEGAALDDRGIYDLVSDAERGSDDFERWFARRSDRRGGTSERYLDDRVGRWGDDLDTHGRWVMVSGIGWSWRPYVSVGWRPYYNGYWHRSRHGYLTWVSYEPWGWLPYHYGRWSYDSMYGWVWVPGGGYAPAWVYWWYTPSYFGWAPMGFWDCYTPYYDWAYRPYTRNALTFGVGFYGRIRVDEMDLRPWTFIDANTVLSTRVDRAALTVDAVKQRLGRTGGNFATVSSEPARFTNDQYRDPAAAIKAIARRGVGDPATAPGAAASITDVTAFFRRDGDVGAAVRDRIVSSRGNGTTVAASPSGARGGSAAAPSAGAPAPIGRGATAVIGREGVAPIGREGVAPIGRGAVAPIGREGVAPIAGRGASAPVAGSTTPTAGRGGAIGRDAGDRWRTDVPSGTTGRDSGAIRRRGDDPSATPGGVSRGTVTTPSDAGNSGSVQRGRGATAPRAVPDDSWRRRPTSTPDRSGASSGERSYTPRSTTREPSSVDVPRRVIDRIGGARVVPRDGGSSSREGRAPVYAPPSSRSGHSGASRGGSGSSSRGGGASIGRPSGWSGGGSSGGSSSRGSSAGSGSGSGASSTPSSSPAPSSGGSRSPDGAIHRDH